MARIGREKRAKDFDEYVKRLREKANVKIDDAELEKVVVVAAQVPQVPAAPGAQPMVQAAQPVAGQPGQEANKK